MKFRKLMLVLTLTVSIIFVTVIGATYAYYTTSGGGFNITTGNVDKSLGIVFNNSDHIDLNTGIPISSSDVETKASTVTFTLVPNSQMAANYHLSAAIGLSNIEIDDALKVSDFKYRLACRSKVNYSDSTPTSTGTMQTFNGNAASFISSSYTIATLSTESSGNDAFTISNAANVASQMYECTLYIWLEESGLNQNALMNKHFEANVEITSTMKKR